MQLSNKIQLTFETKTDFRVKLMLSNVYLLFENRFQFDFIYLWTYNNLTFKVVRSFNIRFLESRKLYLPSELTWEQNIKCFFISTHLKIHSFVRLRKDYETFLDLRPNALMGGTIKKVWCVAYSTGIVYENIIMCVRTVQVSHSTTHLLLHFDWKLVSTSISTNSRIKRANITSSTSYNTFQWQNLFFKIVTFLQIICLTSTEAFLWKTLKGLGTTFAHF